MRAIHLDVYSPHFKNAGIRRGVDLKGLTETVLQDRVGVQDEFHRQIILECLKELEGGANSVVNSSKYAARVQTTKEL